MTKMQNLMFYREVAKFFLIVAYVRKYVRLCCFSSTSIYCKKY